MYHLKKELYLLSHCFEYYLSENHTEYTPLLPYILSFFFFSFSTSHISVYLHPLPTSFFSCLLARSFLQGMLLAFWLNWYPKWQKEIRRATWKMIRTIWWKSNKPWLGQSITQWRDTFSTSMYQLLQKLFWIFYLKSLQLPFEYWIWEGKWQAKFNSGFILSNGNLIFEQGNTIGF